MFTLRYSLLLILMPLVAANLKKINKVQKQHLDNVYFILESEPVVFKFSLRDYPEM